MMRAERRGSLVRRLVLFALLPASTFLLAFLLTLCLQPWEEEQP